MNLIERKSNTLLGKHMRRVAIVTGATKNVGYGIVERFINEGYDVVVTSRSAAAAQSAAERLKTQCLQARTLGVGMDPGSVPDIRRAFAKIEQVMERIDVLVVNAANLGMDMNIFFTTENDWDSVMNANAKGCFFCCQEAVRRMGAGSAICLISSTHSRQSLPDRIVYAASKGAMNVIARTCAVECAHKGIRVNTIIAGPLWTDRWNKLSQEERQTRRDIYPCGHESKPEDVASAVYFLCSDQSSTITGAEVVVDSGVTLSLERPFDNNWRPQGRENA